MASFYEISKICMCVGGVAESGSPVHCVNSRRRHARRIYSTMLTFMSGGVAAASTATTVISQVRASTVISQVRASTVISQVRVSRAAAVLMLASLFLQDSRNVCVVNCLSTT